MCRQLNWQVVFIDDLITHEVSQRHFSGWDQRVVAAVCFLVQRTGMEQIAGKFRQLARTVQRIVVDQIRHVGFAVAMLLGVQIQHELRQRAVQMGNLAFHHHKTRAGQLNRCRKVQARVHFAQRHVIAHFEVKLTRRTPAFHFNVVVFIFADRHAVVRNIRDSQGNITNLGLKNVQLSFCLIQFFTQFVHFQA